MSPVSTNHITVCICTFKRPKALGTLLLALDRQNTAGEFSYDIVVVDNDASKTAAETCDAFASAAATPVRYHVEPEQNIARARNRAVARAQGQFVALIDDDEMPGAEWLLTLYRAQRRFGRSGVLGPVLPQFESTPPRWVVEGKFYDRPSHETGTVLDWQQTRTGNALLSAELFRHGTEPFRPDFGMGGEDRDFFKRMIAAGHQFVWCAEAPVWELIPPQRCTRSFMLRRALLRGTIPQFSWTDIGRSIIAVPLYALMLPVCLAMGQHVVMKYLIKSFDHAGRLLAVLDIKVIRQKYILE